MIATSLKQLSCEKGMSKSTPCRNRLPIRASVQQTPFRLIMNLELKARILRELAGRRAICASNAVKISLLMDALGEDPVDFVTALFELRDSDRIACVEQSIYLVGRP